MSGSGIYRAMVCSVESVMADPEMEGYEEREPTDIMTNIPRNKRVMDAASANNKEVQLYREDQNVRNSKSNATSYDDAVMPGVKISQQNEDETSLSLFLRVRKMDHYSTALSQIGARTISDLAFLTPQDLETVGIRPDDIDNLAVKVVQ